MDGDSLMRRHDALVSYRQPWEPMWERVSRLVLPRANEWEGWTQGQQRNLQQYDSFPMGALDKFAAAIEAGLMPRQSIWHYLSTGVDELDEQRDVKIYLEDLNRLLWRARYSPLGNFTAQAHEVRLSLGLLGTGPMLIEQAKNGGIRYRAIHLSEIWIDENADGVVDTVHRKFELSARQAVQMFGADTPDKVLKKYNDGHIHERFEFLHCVAPREDYEQGRLDMKGMPIAGYYVFCETKEVVREDGYYEMPYVVPRYSVSTRERYGRSPAVMRLPDISMLNEMKRTMIEAANMAVDPPSLTADDISEFDLQPGTVNPGTVDDNGRPRVIPFQSGIAPGIGLDMMADTRDQIDDGFLGLYFRVLLENPNMTATQAMLIAQQQGQMTTPVIGRLQSEWLAPMIRRESAILYRQGKHPTMPPALREYLREEKRPLEIDYVSPLTRAARAEELIGIARSFEMLAPVAQFDPTVYEGIKGREIAKLTFEVNGVSPKVLATDEEMEAKQQRDAAMAEMGAILEAAPIAAQTAKTLAETQKIAGSQPNVPGGA